jgi:hypothetical protein
MNRLIVATCSFAMLATVAGCRSDDDRGDRRDRPRMSQREVMNRSKLEPYPNEVEAAFIRDYPTANVTSVDVYNDATGSAVYEVNYVRDGRAGDAVYSAEGVRVEAPANRVSPPDATAPPDRTAPPPPPRSNR